MKRAAPYAVMDDEGNLVVHYSSYNSAYSRARSLSARSGRKHRVVRLEGGAPIPLEHGGKRPGAGAKPGSGRGNKNAAKPPERQGVQAGRISRLARARVKLLARQWGVSFREALERCVEAAWSAHAAAESSRREGQS